MRLAPRQGGSSNGDESSIRGYGVRPEPHRSDRVRQLGLNLCARQRFEGSAAAVDACAFVAGLLVDAIGGMQKEGLLRPREFEGDHDVVYVAAGSWKGKSRDDIQSSGYVIHTLEAALWSVEFSAGFKEAILLAANLGGDADTVAAVTGQLAGSLWGAEEIPMPWKARLAWREHIENLGVQLFDRQPRVS